MIKHLEFLNYRSHKHTGFDLEPLTVFVGPNGGGKSNIFKGLVLLQTSVNRSPAEYFGTGPFDFWAQRHRGEESATASIAVGARIAGLDALGHDSAEYRIEIAQGSAGEIYIALESLELTPPEHASQETLPRLYRTTRTQRLGEFGNTKPTDDSLLRKARRLPDPRPSSMAEIVAAVADHVSRYGYYHLEAGDLRRTSSEFDSVQRLGYNGRDLPGALSALRESPEGESCLARIEDQVRELVPRLRALRVVPVGQDQIGLAADFEGYSTHLTSADLSDGTLFTLGMLTVIHQRHLPAVLAIEEPETGLHPRRLSWLMDKLVELAHGSDGRPPVQVLVSTHSPYLLDYFRDMPEAVRIVECVEGATRVRALPEVLGDLHIDVEELKDRSLGEQWYSGVFEQEF